MKYLISFLAIGVLNLNICLSQDNDGKRVISQSDTLKFEPSKVEEGDTTEYELIVLDPGYESFLITQPSKDFYSENYYKSWNNRYVQEWNNRYTLHGKSGLYETYIDYDPNTEYGLELEYRLYNFFLYFEKMNGVKLLPRGR